MEELFRLISDEYAAVIKSRLFLERLNEVRIINGAPVRVSYDGAYYFLTKSGLSKDGQAAFIAPLDEADRIVMRACSHSLYTVTDTLKRGFISVKGGLRLGVCGEGVMNDNALTAVKNFSSVNIRLPHEVKGFASNLFPKLVGIGIKNAIVISPPGAGKTTLLRDLCRLISNRGFCVLLCDEKYEIAACSNGAPTLDVGVCTDVISGVDKPKVFEMGIANMRPDVIITDELFPSDMESVARATTCGIAVIASVHAENIEQLRLKRDWRSVIEQGLFDSYVMLSAPPRRTVTVYEGVSL